MKLKATAPQTATFLYRQHPTSGNQINGLGEEKPRRARYVFHSNAKTGPLPWDRMQTLFRYTYPWWAILQLLKNAWASFRPQGRLAESRTPVRDARQMTGHIKEKARELGAGIVGIAEMKDEYLIEGYRSQFRYVISLGLPMDRDSMLEAPRITAGMEVLRVYYHCSLLTVNLARYIRSLGWPAQGFPVNSSSELLHIPAAIAAGLGELGKHGSLISREYGSNFRLTSVLTDLPLVPDGPVDIGVDDLCRVCKVCVRDCPPDAIFDEKQMVRGTPKWYVDFDKCTPYFADNYGCAICLEVCPWSEPGRGPRISKLLLDARKRRQ